MRSGDQKAARIQDRKAARMQLALAPSSQQRTSKPMPVSAHAITGNAATVLTYVAFKLPWLASWLLDAACSTCATQPGARAVVSATLNQVC